MSAKQRMNNIYHIYLFFCPSFRSLIRLLDRDVVCCNRVSASDVIRSRRFPGHQCPVCPPPQSCLDVALSLELDAQSKQTSKLIAQVH